MKTAAGCVLALLLLGHGCAWADQNYSQQVFFDNSLSADNYFYSEGVVTAPSTLRLIDGKLPVEMSDFVSAPNALQLQWSSVANGGWSAEVRLYQWRNREVLFPGAKLFLWVCAAADLAAADLPHLVLRDKDGGFSQPLDLSAYTHDIKQGQWARVGVPLAAFRSASLRAFAPHRITTLIFVQGAADASTHTLLLDDIRVEDDASPAQAAPATPTGVQAKGYERHIDIVWSAVEDPALAQYVIYRSTAGGPFKAIGVQRPGVQRFCDYTGDVPMTAAYRVTARTSSLLESSPSAAVSAGTHSMTDEELLTMVQEAGFRYYWEAAEPHSGMTRENTPGDDDVVAVGASGFGIMATVVGADRGFITHQQAIDRLVAPNRLSQLQPTVITVRGRTFLAAALAVRFAGVRSL